VSYKCGQEIMQMQKIKDASEQWDCRAPKAVLAMTE